VNLLKNWLTVNFFLNRLTEKNYIIEIESKISKIIKRCATLRTKVLDRHDDRLRIAINAHVMLVHRTRLLIWQVSLKPLF